MLYFLGGKFVQPAFFLAGNRARNGVAIVVALPSLSAMFQPSPHGTSCPWQPRFSFDQRSALRLYDCFAMVLSYPLYHVNIMNISKKSDQCPIYPFIASIVFIIIDTNWLSKLFMALSSALAVAGDSREGTKSALNTLS